MVFIDNGIMRSRKHDARTGSCDAGWWFGLRVACIGTGKSTGSLNTCNAVANSASSLGKCLYCAHTTMDMVPSAEAVMIQTISAGLYIGRLRSGGVSERRALQCWPDSEDRRKGRDKTQYSAHQSAHYEIGRHMTPCSGSTAHSMRKKAGDAMSWGFAGRYKRDGETEGTWRDGRIR